MKLSTKIFSLVVGLTISAMIVVVITIAVQVKDEQNNSFYRSDYISVKSFKAIEIQNNWNISIRDMDDAPTQTRVDSKGDTLESCKLYGVNFSHFDPDFIEEAKEHIEIRNDTLYFKSMSKTVHNCHIYVEPSFKEIKISGNSNVTMEKNIGLNQLNAHVFENAMLSMYDVPIHNLNVEVRNNARVIGYLGLGGMDKTETRLNKIELYDYGRADISGAFVKIDKSIVEDHASLVFHGNFAMSKTKQVSLKKEWSR